MVVRFTTQKHSNVSYSVVDTQANKYKMPEQAVSLYFSTEDAALSVATILNIEWTNFLAGPE